MWILTSAERFNFFLSLFLADSTLRNSHTKIIHPSVRQRFIDWALEYPNEPYILYEAAILFESGYANDFDLNILILADENIRIGRVIKRDNISDELVRDRIKNQMTDSQKMKFVDYIIENNNRQLLIPQIIELDLAIRKEM